MQHNNTNKLNKHYTINIRTHQKHKCKQRQQDNRVELTNGTLTLTRLYWNGSGGELHFMHAPVTLYTVCTNLKSKYFLNLTFNSCFTTIFFSTSFLFLLWFFNLKQFSSVPGSGRGTWVIEVGTSERTSLSAVVEGLFDTLVIESLTVLFSPSKTSSLQIYKKVCID